MDPNFFALRASRRSTAAGIWLLLAVLMASVTPDGPVIAGMFVLLMVSISSAIALMLVGRDQFLDTRFSFVFRSMLVPVAFAMPLAWALLLGSRNNSLIGALFPIIAIIPVALACVVMASRSATKTRNVHAATFISPSTTQTKSIEISTNEIDDIHTPASEIRLHQSALPLINDGDDVLESSIESDSPISSNLTQWLTRSLTTDGEIIEGGVRIDFVDGQRDATVHVSFCPPLVGVPELDTEDLDDGGVEIRVNASFPFGARLTVRRRIESSISGEKRFSAESCRIGFVAIANSGRRAG